MTKETTLPTTSPSGAGGPSNGIRTAVSLALFLHLFCVFVALSSNYAPSGLAAGFLQKLRLYTQVFNFDPDSTAFYLTHAQVFDVDHQIQVLPRDADETDSAAWRTLGQDTFHGGERFRRYARLGKKMDLASVVGDEERVALLASGAGRYFLNHERLIPKQIRCRRHLLVEIDAYSPQGTPQERDASGAGYFSVEYAANAVVDEEVGSVEVVKIEASGQVARPTGNP